MTSPTAIVIAGALIAFAIRPLAVIVTGILAPGFSDLKTFSVGSILTRPPSGLKRTGAFQGRCG
jgi:hypothetical protein